MTSNSMSSDEFIASYAAGRRPSIQQPPQKSNYDFAQQQYPSMSSSAFPHDNDAVNSLRPQSTLQFQCPSFLLGAPTPAAGGGADAYPGSFASFDFGPWIGGGTPGDQSLSKYDSIDPSYKVHSPLPLPAPREPQPRPQGPFPYTAPNPDSTALSSDSNSASSPAASRPQPSHPGPHVEPLPSPTEPIAPNLPATEHIVGPGAPPLYSTTGFDMLGVLARVAARPNPTISLGPVDLSCSFVVVDVRRYDHPIVYASPTFFKLTGYDSHEVLGRNCRFLQAPDGLVEKGSHRTFTDHAAVAHIKKCLSQGKECQANLMNYRKGGIPFLNLVSIIPISWDDPDEIQFHVGFQVDLVHQPNAILETMRDGSYSVNYSTTVTSASLARALGHRRSIGAGSLPSSLRNLLADLVPGGTMEVAKATEEQNVSAFCTQLLDHADDFVHVFSVKGIVQYASPSFLRALEYTADELIGHSIAEFAHPEDITPVMRELKDASTVIESTGPITRLIQKTVQLLFRVKRKHSGLVWLETSGRLHVEPGKTRKSVIFSGRLRELPSLTWNSIKHAGGLSRSLHGAGRTEFWAQVSTATQLFLFIEEGVEDVLGLKSDALLGSSFLDIFDATSRQSLADAVCHYAASPMNDPYVFKGNVLHPKQALGRPCDVVLYPPPSHKSPPVVKTPAHASLLVQVCIHSTAPTHKPFHYANSNSLSVALLEELNVGGERHWNYEVQTVKQSNEKLKSEIHTLMSDVQDVSSPDVSS